ncbi:MAG: cytochrome c oxidase Cu(A) center assembly protein [Akkermansiaceae bacterium]|nr:cytochrome c oxidase Cu(A) center assembly protein [Akkermansiaceae bacterium]
MRTPAADLEPVVVDPRKLRRTAWILVVIMLVGGFAIYFSYLEAAKREANDDRPSIISRLSNQKDFEFIRQDSSPGKMSDLYGDVWLVCGISAKQPETWAATREVLRKMSERYADRKDFHILCLTVDPDNEGPEVLAPLADSLGAKLPEWWFAAAGQEYIHKFLKNDLKLEIIPRQENGKWIFDPTITVIDRDLHLRKGTAKVSTHRRQPFPFNFEEAAKMDRESAPPENPQRTTRKLEELLIHVIDYTLAQPITKP